MMVYMQIIFPNDFMKSSAPDQAFKQLYLCTRENGLHCVLLSAENAALVKYHFFQAFKPDIPVIWRGWMLKEDEYQQLRSGEC